jgi:glutathione S-transferase
LNLNITASQFSIYRLVSSTISNSLFDMVLKLYGYHMSTCTRRAAVVLQEKKVPYEFIPVDITKGEHKQPEYLKSQPFGQVPYLVRSQDPPLLCRPQKLTHTFNLRTQDDDGFILFESRAIAEYVALKYADQGTPLVPGDFKKLALSKQAQSIEVTDFNPYAERAVLEMVIKP